MQSDEFLYPCRYCGKIPKLKLNCIFPNEITLAEDCLCHHAEQIMLYIGNLVKMGLNLNVPERLIKTWNARNEKHNPFLGDKT